MQKRCTIRFTAQCSCYCNIITVKRVIFPRCKFSRMGSRLGKIYSGLLYNVRLWVAIVTLAIVTLAIAHLATFALNSGVYLLYRPLFHQ